MNIKEMINVTHEIAKEKGWHDTDKGDETSLLLMHSEISEIVEELRSGKDVNDMYFDKHSSKPLGIPIELADLVLRVFDFCGKHDIDLEEAIEIKTKFNRTRPKRHGGKRF